MAPTQAEQVVINEAEVEKFWKAFSVFDTDGSGAISADELGNVMRSLGQAPTATELRDLIKEVDVDRSGSIDFEEFKALMISRQGDQKSRLKLAFNVFDKDNSGRITADEMRNVMSQFGLTDAELDAMVKEVDVDGDGSIGFEEFCQLVPDEAEIEESIAASKAAAPTAVGSAAPATAENGAIAGAVVSTQMERSLDSDPEEPAADINPELEKLKELLSKHPQNEKVRATSRLQMQIGLFRLIQGAAYRCFRESFSANHETHLQVRNLPYRITDFVPFVQTALSLYKGLGIVAEECHPVLDAVVQSISEEYARLEERIQNWATLEKTPEMLAEEQAILAARSKSANAREKFAAGVEFAITMKKQKLNLGDVVEGVLASHELNRLRELELRQEFAPPPAQTEGDPKTYLKRWNRVILSNALETVDGAMMPVAYWYEDFMPKLLAAFSVSTAADLERNTVPDETALNQWYECTRSSGEFDRYGADVAENFPHCTPDQKLRLKQAWQLTHHYLNGVQKRRERLEFGRESGALSQYVAFIDIYLGRSDVRDSQMRVSFPYYIGPAVWRFFHTTAELVDSYPIEQQAHLIAVFKDFFKLFAAMYPCPYCRHHLNAYVVQNREIDMYPVEYLLLGQDSDRSDFTMSIDEKLAAVTDGASLRLFFWKLHNTVSSSIARSEEWYHQDDKAFYTTRYWPSIDSELARASALKQISIATDRIYSIYGLLKPVARLAAVRLELQKLLEKGDTQSLEEACTIAHNYIQALEAAVIQGRFLQETYRFDPNLLDQTPVFTPEEEEFGRSNFFIEV
ncbi:MAG TPA: EF-hand domain-containing protein [Coleofasciculaceae cyanobacterium]|jgi:Ca2+-binding EF-hand superfamily protein